MVDSAADPRERSGRGKADVFNKEPGKDTGHNVFSQPRRVPECRICKVLENDGTPNLFENHLSETFMGCPRFQYMTIEEKRNICIRAKLCMKCCNIKVIFDPLLKKGL